MNKEIKIGDKTFNIVFPTEKKIEELNQKNDITRFLNDWCKLIEKQKEEKNIWYEFPQLPGYKFKNLEVIESPIEVAEDKYQVSITFKYDDVEKT